MKDIHNCQMTKRESDGMVIHLRLRKEKEEPINDNDDISGVFVVHDKKQSMEKKMRPKKGYKVSFVFFLVM